MRHILPIATIVLMATAMHAHAKARHHAAHQHAASIHKAHEGGLSKSEIRLAHRRERHAHSPHRS
jgi:hypothetical protein